MTDYDFVVTVEEDSEGVLLGISHGIGSTECVLRPTQAERLAAELLAYANGDHKLPPDAVRPQRVVVAPDEPETRDAENIRQYLRQIADPSFVGNYDDATVIEIYRKWAKVALEA